MKRPISVLIISKNPKTLQEVRNRFDVLTSFPRLKLFSIFLKAIFSV
ncbi:MAG TPA: hypothetical protein VGR15_04015 [Bacteroidota bacterium]|jgi:hypothetical protein|nr:hypothetical protein [Bacteroidota bacterium]